MDYEQMTLAEATRRARAMRETGWPEARVVEINMGDERAERWTIQATANEQGPYLRDDGHVR